MHGVKRVLMFCLLTTFVPIFLLVIPLYLRNNLYADVVYAVTESDIMEISDGVSTMFCSAHTLHMNSTFNAFQMGHKPEVTSYRKHIRLKKSMTLPDDTLEYWGFYLLRGATVALSVCSKSPGASILVVKGQRTLSTCGLLDHNQNKARKNGLFLPSSQSQVKITFETNAQLIESDEILRPENTDPPKNPKARHKNHNISSETLNRLSPSVKSYIADLITLYNANFKQSNGTSFQRKVRHARKKFGEKIEEFDAEKAQLLEIEDPEPERLRRSERSVKSGFQNPLKVEDREKIERIRAQLLTPDLDVAAEEDSKGAKMFISHRFKPSGRGHQPVKRSLEPMKPPALLDRGVKHGGNAFATAQTSDESSVSSFEDGLFDCYDGNILLASKFPPTNCESNADLLSGQHMQTQHNVTEDGYYYYIFYSDNDFVSNDMHAVFDIWKPTFQYENVSKSCLNGTECTFPLGLMSNDRVIVEIPTRDGIEDEADDVSLLISTCHPRVGLYVVFPIAVLLFVLSCAFL